MSNLTPDDTLQSIEQLTNELEMMGLPTFPPFPEGVKSNIVVNCLVTTMWNVVNHYRKKAEEVISLYEQRQRIGDEKRALESQVRILKSSIEKKEKQIAVMSEKCRVASERKDAAVNEFKKEKEKVRLLNAEQKYKDVKFQHELRRKSENIKQLQQQLCHYSRNSPARGASSKRTNGQKQLYEQALCESKGKQDSLLQEIMDMREILIVLNDDLDMLEQDFKKAVELNYPNKPLKRKSVGYPNLLEFDLSDCKTSCQNHIFNIQMQLEELTRKPIVGVTADQGANSV